MDWENELRPQKFREVRGQPQAVKQVSGQIIRGLRPRPLLLTGAVGSGKTTITRLFASALNCATVDHDGSPCGGCEFCGEMSRYLSEWDTAGRGGDLGCVSALVHQNVAMVGQCRYRVVFFDECHALKSEAQDALLKCIEERPRGIAFCFATTERHRIKPSLLSRLTEVKVYPIGPKDAYEYLELIARQKNLEFDAEALHFLIAAKPPFMRDLIIGLQELAELGERITTELVKDFLGLQACDHLSAYVRGLALGNRPEQIRAMQAWPDDVVEKCLWIERFISSTYYNNVLGIEYVVDPLVHGLVNVRIDFVQKLQERFRLDQQGLKRTFKSMMEFWSTNSVLTSSGAHIALGLFEAMVSEGPCEQAPPCSLAATRIEQQNCLSKRTPVFDDMPEPPLSEFPTIVETREIVNRSSFFAQDRGEFLNTSLSLVFRGEENLEARAEWLLANFISTLDLKFYNRPDPIAAVGVLEREQDVIVARVLAFVSADWRSDFLQLCWAWTSREAQVTDIEVSQGTADHSFHWSAVRDICASCDEILANRVEARRLLGIPRSQWRAAGPLACKRVHFSEGLRRQRIEEACFPAVLPLSAFDAAASTWIGNGWELREAPVRKREVQERRLHLKTLQFQWREDRVRLESERKAILEAWSNVAAEQRARRWRGWW